MDVTLFRKSVVSDSRLTYSQAVELVDANAVKIAFVVEVIGLSVTVNVEVGNDRSNWKLGTNGDLGLGYNELNLSGICSRYVRIGCVSESGSSILSAELETKKL